MLKRCEWTVETPGRLDAAVRVGAELSNSKAKSAVGTGKVRVNGERVFDPATRVSAGDRVALEPAAPNPARTEPLGLRLRFRDDHVIVVDKPSGLTSAPTPQDHEDTALHGVQKLCHGPRRPKVVHRLDKATSGLLAFARSTAAARALREAFDAGAVHRVYRCLVQGCPESRTAMITSMLVRDVGEGRRGSRRGSLRTRPANRPDPGPMPGSGKLAITRFEVVARDTKNDWAALEVRLSTGRTHQIRIHLAEIGHPVLGESVYARVPGPGRLALHAARLVFPHPVTGEQLQFDSPWPEALAKVTPTAAGW